jgi:hypothetical protein
VYKTFELGSTVDKSTFYAITIEGWRHRVIMYFIEAKATSRHPYFGQLPMNTYLSVVFIAAVATELGG